MSNEVALINTEELGLQKYDDKAFDAVSSGKYLPRIQFMSSASELCKDGTFPINHYALFKGKTPIDLSPEVNVLVIAWRPKAMRLGDSIITAFDVEDPEFKKIVDESGTPDSGCMYGPEYLCYIPSTKEFATFFMGSKSSRNEAPNMKALIGKGATLKSQKLSNAKYSWVTPQVIPCTVPFEVPAIEEIKKVAEPFINPPKSEVETVEDSGEKRAR